MYKAKLLSSPHFMEMNTEVIQHGENFDKGLPITLRSQILNPPILPAAMYPNICHESKIKEKEGLSAGQR